MIPQKHAGAYTASPVPVDPPLWGKIQVNAKQRLDANHASQPQLATVVKV
jgi:hypothetical protein